MCICDDDGTPVPVKTLYLSPLYHVDVGEALDLFHALQWVHDLRLDNMGFAFDSKNVVDHFNKDIDGVNEFFFGFGFPMNIARQHSRIQHITEGSIKIKRFKFKLGILNYI